MVNYTPSNQLSLSLFKHLFERDLDPNNRWVKLAELIPWDELASVYASKLRSNEGHKSVDIRHVLVLLYNIFFFYIFKMIFLYVIFKNIYCRRIDFIFIFFNKFRRF